MKLKIKRKIKDIIAFIEGNLRYSIYYSKFACLLPPYIKEQIEVRINSMNKQCYLQGACVKCGCKTTALQMANKTCDGLCYPDMLAEHLWEGLKKGQMVLSNEHLWYVKNNRFYKTDSRYEELLGIKED